jgi:hypothetical protein
MNPLDLPLSHLSCILRAILMPADPCNSSFRVTSLLASPTYRASVYIPIHYCLTEHSLRTSYFCIGSANVDRLEVPTRAVLEDG